jgi:hypothetical protein
MSAAPELMYEHGFDAKKGWFDMSALDYSAKLSGNVEFDVPRGRVAHLNEDGEFEMGCHNTGISVFLMQGSLDFDVQNAGTTPAGNFMHKAIMPSGDMSGLVASGGYELDSTEFIKDNDYTAGDLLTAAADNADIDVGGLLTNAVGSDPVEQFVDPVCGVVSSGKHQNHNRIWTLSFWTVWLPGAAA